MNYRQRGVMPRCNTRITHFRKKRTHFVVPIHFVRGQGGAYSKRLVVVANQFQFLGTRVARNHCRFPRDQFESPVNRGQKIKLIPPALATVIVA